MAAHRYWRINCRAGNGTGFFGAREIELRTSIGGADVTGSGTASASTTAAGTAAAAFDNTTAEWAGATPCTLTYDFGVGNAFDIVEASITNRSVGAQAPVDFDLQWSDDNSSWTTLYSVWNSNWFNATTNVFNASSHPTIGNSTSKTFWRVNCAAVDGGTVFGIAELEMFTSTNGSGTSVCAGGTPFAQTSFIQSPAGFYYAVNAFDGSSSTMWAGASAAQWVGYLCASAQDVKSISIRARPDSNTNQSPKNFTIQYWDGSAFQTFATLTNITGWTSGQKRYFAASGEISAPSATARRQPIAFFAT